MTVLVVFESMYGSTQAVAEAIGRGLSESGRVQVKEIGALASAPGSRTISEDMTLLVVGAPVHGRVGLPRESTRIEAMKDAPNGRIITANRGVREWIDDLTMPTGGVRVATFETKQVKAGLLTASAAEAAEKGLKGLGGRPVAPPKSFLVTGRTSGLVDGELESALAWGRRLGAVPGVRPRH